MAGSCGLDSIPGPYAVGVAKKRKEKKKSYYMTQEFPSWHSRNESPGLALWVKDLAQTRLGSGVAVAVV